MSGWPDQRFKQSGPLTFTKMPDYPERRFIDTAAFVTAIIARTPWSIFDEVPTLKPRFAGKMAEAYGE